MTPYRVHKNSKGTDLSVQRSNVEWTPNICKIKNSCQQSFAPKKGPLHRTRCSPTHNLKHLNQECQSHKLHSKIAHMTPARARAAIVSQLGERECIAQENQFSTVRRAPRDI
jgi:hypothetical protein